MLRSHIWALRSHILIKLLLQCISIPLRVLQPTILYININIISQFSNMRRKSSTCDVILIVCTQYFQVIVYISYNLVWLRPQIYAESKCSEFPIILLNPFNFAMDYLSIFLKPYEMMYVHILISTLKRLNSVKGAMNI